MLKYEELYLNAKRKYLKLRGGVDDNNNSEINNNNNDNTEMFAQLNIFKSQKFFTIDEFNKLCDILKKTNVPFEDLYFGVPDVSMFKLSSFGVNKYDLSKIEFKKPTDYFRKPVLFLEDPEPDDIKQGYLGDCYLMAALCAMATTPNVIRDLFIDRSDVGVYGIKFYVDGKQRIIVINDLLPTYKWKLISAQSIPNRNLWVIMLEKAYAKLHNFYGAINGGIAGNSFNILTGAPTDYFINDPNKGGMISLIERNLKSGHYIECTFKDQTYNLFDQHAYAILNIVRLKYKNSSSEQILIQIKNPHRTEDWFGEWSGKLNKYFELTPEMKKSMQVEINQTIRDIIYNNINDIPNINSNDLDTAQLDIGYSAIESSNQDINNKGYDYYDYLNINDHNLDVNDLNIGLLQNIQNVNNENGIMKPNKKRIKIKINDKMKNKINDAIAKIKETYMEIMRDKAITNIKNIRRDLHIRDNILDSDIKKRIDGYLNRVDPNDWNKKSEHYINSSVNPELQRIFKGGNGDNKTDNINLQYGVDYGKSGIFFMSESDFLQNCKLVDVCYYHKNYVISTITSNYLTFTVGEKRKERLQITIQHPGFYYIYFRIQNPLINDTSGYILKDDYKTYTASYALELRDEQNYLLRESSYEVIAMTMEPGIYTINLSANRPKNFVNNDFPNETILLHIYGENIVNI